MITIFAVEKQERLIYKKVLIMIFKKRVKMFLFDRDIGIKRIEADSDREMFAGDLSNNWGVNNVPNGGYLMAVVANAMVIK